MAKSLVVGYGAPDEKIVFGEGKAGGWAYVRLPKAEFDKSLWIMVTEVGDPGGGRRLVIGGMWVDTLLGITGRGLARLPLGRIEAAINSPAVAEQIRSLMEDGEAGLHHPRTPPPTHHSIPPLIELAGRAKPTDGPSRRPPLRIRVPDTRKRDDNFYRRVAEVFSAQATVSTSPARDIAVANDVPVTTVHRWIKEARRRGLLASARREKGERT